MRECKSAWVLLALVLGACARQRAERVELPQAISDAMPFVYPITLWDDKIEGQVMLSLRITDTGAVDSVLVTRSSGYVEFDSAAVKGAHIMKFTPGKQGERRVAMWTRLPVTFARDTMKMGLGGQ